MLCEAFAITYVTINLGSSSGEYLAIYPLSCPVVPSSCHQILPAICLAVRNSIPLWPSGHARKRKGMFVASLWEEANTVLCPMNQHSWEVIIHSLGGIVHLSFLYWLGYSSYLSFSEYGILHLYPMWTSKVFVLLARCLCCFLKYSKTNHRQTAGFSLDNHPATAAPPAASYSYAYYSLSRVR